MLVDLVLLCSRSTPLTQVCAQFAPALCTPSYVASSVCTALWAAADLYMLSFQFFIAQPLLSCVAAHASGMLWSAMGR
jgi:hypothetical protein